MNVQPPVLFLSHYSKERLEDKRSMLLDSRSRQNISDIVLNRTEQNRIGRSDSTVCNRNYQCEFYTFYPDQHVDCATFVNHLLLCKQQLFFSVTCNMIP